MSFVQNQPTPKNSYAFQQGQNSYLGCSSYTASAQGEKSSNLECFNWKKGTVEFKEFYLKFDLPKNAIPKDATLKKATLKLYCNRQNFQSTKGKPANYLIGLVDGDFATTTSFETRPASPAWSHSNLTTPAAALAGTWPKIGARQDIWPPVPVNIDLTPLKDEVLQWIKEPSSNMGLVFTPLIDVNYNFSAIAPDSRHPTLRPVLILETNED